MQSKNLSLLIAGTLFLAVLGGCQANQNQPQTKTPPVTTGQSSSTVQITNSNNLSGNTAEQKQ